MKVNKNNFFKASDGNFRPKNPPKRTFDFESEHGSKYWYTSKGVYRHSNHWGRVKYCNWTFEGEPKSEWLCKETEFKTGYCKWADFRFGVLKLSRRKEGFQDRAKKFFEYAPQAFIEVNGQVYSKARAIYKFGL